MFIWIKELLNNMKLRDKNIILLIFIVALSVRLVYFLKFSDLECIYGPDATEYNSYAVNLLSGNGYQNNGIHSFRPPGYPFFLAGVYAIFGHSFIIVQIIQLIISAFNCIIIFLIGLEISNKSVAVFSGFFSCFFYSLYIMPSNILTETLFTFLLSLSILFYLRMDRKPIYEIVAPILLGTATLTRSTTLVFPFFIFFWFFLKYPLKAMIKKIFLTSILFLLVLLPWTMRNYLVHHAFVPVHIQAGMVFWGANNSLAGGKWNEHGPDWGKYSNLSELEKNNKYFNEGLMWLKNQSFLQIIKLYLLKTSVFFYPFFEGRINKPVPKYDLTFGIILPFWILGMYFAVKLRNIQSLLLLLLIITYFISTLVFYTNERLRSPISSEIIIFAAIGIYSIFDRFKKNIYRYSFFTIWVVSNVLVYIYSEPIHSVLKLIIRKTREL
ncbi:MAG: glycosyltransferase family 39 protein [Elusimicrobia bacterium]|nr:glycosyltransferase family 39 protein [Elusimicrobiota bacterium]